MQDLIFPIVQASNEVDVAGLWSFPEIAIGRFPGIELMCFFQEVSVLSAKLDEALRMDSFGCCLVS